MVSACEKNLREREIDIDLIKMRTVLVEMHFQSVMCIEKKERLIKLKRD